MKLRDVAQQYVQLSISNAYTTDQVLRTAEMFDQRSGIQSLEDISLESLITYRKRTLDAVREVTYNGYLKYLRILGKFAVDHGYLEHNWFQRLPMEAEPEAPYKVIDLEELQQVLNFLDENPLRYKPSWFWSTVIRTLYYTGMRRRQLVMIDWRDLNFIDRKIRCRSQGSKTKREWSIPMDKRLVPYLLQYKALLELELERKVASTEPVFNICLLNDRFTPHKLYPDRMRPESFTGTFGRLRRAVGIKRFSPHKMRHTTATELCNPRDGSRPDIFTAQKILGHSSIATTRGYVVTRLQRMEKELSAIPDI